MAADKNQPLILFLFEDELSPFYASVGLARALERDGCNVIYGCSQETAPHLSKLNLKYYVFTGREQGVLEAEFKTFIGQHSPDLVLLDPTLPDVGVVLLKYNLRLVGLTNNLGSVMDPNGTPVFSNVRPIRNAPFLSKVLNGLAWINLYLRFKILTSIFILIHLIRYKSLPAYATLGKTLKKYGIGVRWGEYGYRMRIPELILSPVDLDFPSVSRWNPRYYIGALVDTENISESFDWVAIDQTKPIAYCSLGSHGQHYDKAKIFLRHVVKVFSKMDWELIVQINSDEIVEYLSNEQKSNTHIFKWVPQRQILSKASLFITHGGFGSIKESLFFKVPMVVCPFHADHFGNASRVDFLNFGKRLLRYDDERKLEESIQSVVSDNSIKKSVAAINEKIRSENVKEVVALIKRLAPMGPLE